MINTRSRSRLGSTALARMCRVIVSATIVAAAGCAAHSAGPRGSPGSDLVPVAGGRGTTPTPRSLKTSTRATPNELELGREEGEAEEIALARVRSDGAAASGEMTAGDYIVTYLFTPPAAYYEPEAIPGRLTLHNEIQLGSAHLGVVIRDAADGRSVAGLTVSATLTGSDGTAAPTLLPAGWYPDVNRYGENVQLPAGPFTLRLRIEPPQYPRADSANGYRFVSVAVAEFTGVSVSDTALARSARLVAQEDGRLSRARALAVGRAYGVAARALEREWGAPATVRSGSYEVTLATGPATGAWVPAKRRDGLVYEPVARRKEGIAVALIVRDTRSGRLVTDLYPRVTIADTRGRIVSDRTGTFVWHPWASHYEATVQVPRTAQYAVRVRAAAPLFRRYGEDTRELFVRALDVTFSRIPVRTAGVRDGRAAP